MNTPVESRKTLSCGGLAGIEARLPMSLSLDDLPDRPGARDPLPPEIRDLVAEPLLDWSDIGEPFDAEPLLDDAAIADPTGEWNPSPEPLL